MSNSHFDDVVAREHSRPEVVLGEVGTLDGAADADAADALRVAATAAGNRVDVVRLQPIFQLSLRTPKFLHNILNRVIII